MHSTPRRLLLLLPASFFAGVAHAHPGHDGHELTWDLGHLAAHPLATLACAAITGVAVWTLWRAGRSAVQSLRASQPRRGK